MNAISWGLLLFMLQITCIVSIKIQIKNYKLYKEFKQYKDQLYQEYYSNFIVLTNNSDIFLQKIEEYSSVINSLPVHKQQTNKCNENKESL